MFVGKSLGLRLRLRLNWDTNNWSKLLLLRCLRWDKLKVLLLLLPRTRSALLLLLLMLLLLLLLEALVCLKIGLLFNVLLCCLLRVEFVRVLLARGVNAVGGMRIQGLVMLILVGLYLRLLGVRLLIVWWGRIMGVQATVAVRVGAVLILARIAAAQTLLEALLGVDTSERRTTVLVRVGVLANGRRWFGLVVGILGRRNR